MVGDNDAEGSDREVRAASGGEEENDVVARSYHDTLLFVKLRQAVRQTTNKERGGCLLPDDPCTNTG